jgi:peptide/nickel transport system permease protein
MLKLILRRVALGALTIALVSLIIFGAIEALPGDACTAVLQQDARGEPLLNCQKELGLDRPATTRYAEWMTGALRGDFGMNAHRTKRISEMVGDRVLNSLLLGICALAVGLPVAFLFGILAALRRDRALDLTVSSIAIAAMTIPEFVSATVLILVFSGWLGWLPGIVTTSASAPLKDFFPEIILPVVVLSMVMTAHILRTVRSSMLEVLDSDYVRMATLKGVPYRRMILVHVLPNALLPAINVVADGQCHLRPRPGPGADHRTHCRLRVRGREPERRRADLAGQSAPAHRSHARGLTPMSTAACRAKVYQ